MARKKDKGKGDARRCSKPIRRGDDGELYPREAVEAFRGAIDSLGYASAAKALGLKSTQRVGQLKAHPEAASAEQYARLTAAAFGTPSPTTSTEARRYVDETAEDLARRANRLSLVAQVAGVLLMCSESGAQAIANAAALAMRANECAQYETGFARGADGDGDTRDGYADAQNDKASAYDGAREVFAALAALYDMHGIAALADGPNEMLATLARAARGDIRTRRVQAGTAALTVTPAFFERLPEFASVPEVANSGVWQHPDPSDIPYLERQAGGRDVAIVKLPSGHEMPDAQKKTNADEELMHETIRVARARARSVAHGEDGGDELREDFEELRDLDARAYDVVTPPEAFNGLMRETLLCKEREDLPIEWAGWCELSET